ncbi:hypothetical protein [Nocardia sp. alder85J]|uniref:hypothetical protein n=1 Tax=Nocardia sp. alder85J TaxID=2862949 RepID=UPI001CD5A782|nr:hypothetical protein [Nocardia sp. alder85J]MCX4094608.1 hypothetical protein [Nocardia sp. alder85J]
MPQAPEQSPDPVVHVTQQPRFVSQPDGRVRAYYPGEDWYVVGIDQADAVGKLASEVDHRMQDPDYVADHFAMTQRHLAGERTPGFEAHEISRAEYERRGAATGERLRDATAPERRTGE